MSKPKLPKHLMWRGDVIQYVRRIPKDIRDHPSFGGKNAIRQSLGTADVRQAVSEAAVLDGEVEAKIRRIRDERRLASLPKHHDVMPVDQVRSLVERALVIGIGSVGNPNSDFVDDLLAEKNMTVSDGLRLRMQQEAYHAAKREEAKQLSHPFGSSNILLSSQDVATAYEDTVKNQIEARNATVEEVWEAFKADPGRNGLADANKTYTPAIDMLLEVVGRGRLIRTVTRDELRKVQKILTALPTYARDPRRRPEYDGWTLEAISDDVRNRVDEDEDIELVKPSAANKYLSNIARIFRFAMHEGYVETSVAEGLRVRAEDMASGRSSFSHDQLRKIFNDGWEPKDDVDWMFLMSLLHGCRGNELASLRLSDIEVEHGVLLCNIRKGKTINAARRVPVHQVALRFGFAERVERRRRDGMDGFFDTSPYGKRKRYYDSIREAIDDRLSWLGVKTAQNTFHSFRHNWRDACRDCKIDHGHMLEIGGWSRGQGAQAGYGRGSDIRLLKETVDKIRYDLPMFSGT